MELIDEIENDNIHNEIVLTIYNNLNIVELGDMKYDIIKYLDKVKSDSRYSIIHVLRTRRLLDFITERITSLEFDSIHYN